MEESKIRELVKEILKHKFDKLDAIDNHEFEKAAIARKSEKELQKKLFEWEKHEEYDEHDDFFYAFCESKYGINRKVINSNRNFKIFNRIWNLNDLNI